MFSLTPLIWFGISVVACSSVAWFAGDALSLWKKGQFRMALYGFSLAAFVWCVCIAFVIRGVM